MSITGGGVGTPLRLAADARRYDVSPGWHAWVGTASSLDLLERVGVEALHAHAAENLTLLAGETLTPADAAHAHSTVRPLLELAGCAVCSTWHAPPWSPEDLASMSDLDVVTIYGRNRREVSSADVVLVLDAPGARETHCESEQAYAERIPVVWVGRPHLSARARHATGAWRVVETLEQAIAALEAA